MNLDEITKNECRSEKIKAELCKIGSTILRTDWKEKQEF